MSAPVQENWSSRAAFIFAAVGSAVGLGNIWRFPYITGENGGSAFILIYIAFVIFIGWPVLVAELAIGRRGKMSPIRSMEKVSVESGGSKNWKWVGALGSFGGGLGLLSFYSVIAGWVLAYIIKAATGMFTGVTGGAAEVIRDEHFADTGMMVFWHLAFISLTIYIVGRGINAGLEKAVTYLMPVLFLILLVLLGYGIAEGDMNAAVTFLFTPDFSKINMSVALTALGQAFFSLSLTVGTMLAYGSYLQKDMSIPKSAGIIAAADTGIALIAGLAIFPLVFQYGLTPAEGPSLIFTTLPIAFGQMTGGVIFGSLFFVLLAVAAITSSISLLEPAVAYFVEKQGFGRWKACFFAGGAAFLIGLLSVFSFNIWTDVMPLSFLGIEVINGNPATFYTIIDFTVSNIIMPVGGLMIAIFTGWFVTRAAMRDELDLPEGGLFSLWHILVRYVCPVALIIVIVWGLMP